MSLEGFLDERADHRARLAAQAARDADARLWQSRATGTPEQRLLRFDRWVRHELASRLDWSWAGPAKAKRLEQCRIELETLIRQLFERGWYLDGHRLGGLICDALDEVRAAQDAGRIREFWPFYKSVVRRYVGIHAEEIQADAMALGSTAGQVFAALTRRSPAAPSIPELVAQRATETLREKLARQRRQEARSKASAEQVQLF